MKPHLPTILRTLLALGLLMLGQNASVMQSAHTRGGVEWGFPALGVDLASNTYGNGSSSQGAFAATGDINLELHTGLLGQPYTRFFLEDDGSTNIFGNDRGVQMLGVMQPFSSSASSAIAGEAGLAWGGASSTPILLLGGGILQSSLSGPFVGLRGTMGGLRQVQFNGVIREFLGHDRGQQVGIGATMPLNRRLGFQFDYFYLHVGGPAASNGHIVTVGLRWFIPTGPGQG